MLDLILLIVGVYYYCIWCLYNICNSVKLLLTKPEPVEEEEELTPRLACFVMMVLALRERNHRQDMENLRLALQVDYSPEEQHLWKMQRQNNRLAAAWKRMRTFVHVTFTFVVVFTCSVSWVVAFVGFNAPVVPNVM